MWLALALVRRDAGSFAVYQVSLSLAAVLCAVGWIDSQSWRPELVAGYFGAGALHADAVALGLLALGWAVTRRLLRDNPTARELWTGQPWSAERVVLATVVVGQLLLAALAVIPAVEAELAPVGAVSHRAYWPALAQAFGPGAWPVLGVLAVSLALSWRLTGSERDTDAHLVGLTLLFLTTPVVWAGTHAADTAAATALRWGLGFAFALGTALVALRTQLRRGLEKLGFPAHLTAFTRPAILALLAVAAGVVVYVSANVAELGIAGKKLSGPAAESAFAAMGPLASNLVPLALVVLGLGATAARERSSGYAFAGGLVFTATVAAGYALGVITAGGRLDAAAQLVRVALAGVRRTGPLGDRVARGRAAGRRRGSAGGAVAARARRAGVSGRDAHRARRPGPSGLRAEWAGLGQYGWPVLVLVAGAAVLACRADRARAEVPRACAVGRGRRACWRRVPPSRGTQPGEWLSFHVLGGAWAAVGVGLAVAARRRGESSWWLDGLGLVLCAARAARRVGRPVPPVDAGGARATAAVVVGAAAVLARSASAGDRVRPSREPRGGPAVAADRAGDRLRLPAGERGRAGGRGGSVGAGSDSAFPGSNCETFSTSPAGCRSCCWGSGCRRRSPAGLRSEMAHAGCGVRGAAGDECRGVA